MTTFGIARETAAFSKVAQRTERLFQEDTGVLFACFVGIRQGERTAVGA